MFLKLKRKVIQLFPWRLREEHHLDAEYVVSLRQPGTPRTRLVKIAISSDYREYTRAWYNECGRRSWLVTAHAFVDGQFIEHPGIALNQGYYIDDGYRLYDASSYDDLPFYALAQRYSDSAIQDLVEDLAEYFQKQPEVWAS